MVGYRGNLPPKDASKQYHQLVFDGHLSDLRKEIGAFKGQTPNGDTFVVLFFSPEMGQSKVSETKQYQLAQTDSPLGQGDEVSKLIRTAQNKNVEFEERGKAIRKLGEIGDSRAIEPLMQIYCTELHLIRLDALDAVEKNQSSWEVISRFVSMFHP